MTTHDGGKGDKQIQPKNQEQFDKNWDEIFNKGIPTLEELEEQREKLLASIPFGR
jgi:hypothetical protein